MLGIAGVILLVGPLLATNAFLSEKTTTFSARRTFLSGEQRCRNQGWRVVNELSNGEVECRALSTYSDGDGVNVVPQHVAFICDGNSRWAKSRNLPTSAGHAAGADRLIQVLHLLADVGVRCCTFYGFSTENWKRPQREIDEILMVMEHTAKAFYDKALKEGVQVKILGDLVDDRIPDSLRETLMKLEKDTATIDSQQEVLTVCIAINYGGRRDIMNASIRLAQLIAQGKVDASSITEDDLSDFLCTKDVPDPDLIIRTGGEQRLSNFLLWNVAYAELYFSKVLWPDFNDNCLNDALGWYATRARRFGGRKQQPLVSASSFTNGHSQRP